MFKTLEECWQHASDKMADAVDSVMVELNLAQGNDFEFCESLQKDYNAMALYMTENDHWDKAKVIDIAHTNEEILDPVFLYQMPRDFSPEDADMCNNVMHIIHSEAEKSAGLNMHKQSIADLSYVRGKLHDISDHYFEAGHDFQTYAYADPYEFATGKDAVPAAADKVIHDFFDKFDDVAIDASMSWENSHLDNGEDYHYDIGEAVSITAYGATPESLKQAVDKFDDYIESGEYEKDVKAEQTMIKQKEALQSPFYEHEDIADDSNVPQYEETYTNTEADIRDQEEMQQEIDEDYEL